MNLYIVYFSVEIYTQLWPNSTEHFFTSCKVRKRILVKWGRGLGICISKWAYYQLVQFSVLNKKRQYILWINFWFSKNQKVRLNVREIVEQSSQWLMKNVSKKLKIQLIGRYLKLTWIYFKNRKKEKNRI